MDSEQTHKPANQSIEIGGSVNNGTVILGSKNIVITILNSVDRKALDQDRSITYKEMGRAKVQEWGEQMTHQGEWNWHLLGQAIEYYLDSIKYDPTHQHAWTNLAYAYHLIGERQKARECLQKSLDLATPGPNHPGGNYKRVKAAIDQDAYLTGGRVERPPMPDWFRAKYQRFLS
ncbi:MAG: tetratricopeptide repeat protein [Chloroflexi bacterium]|nr:tetratricopeptide repeat protein [Chloroflexota bacterium]